MEIFNLTGRKILLVGSTGVLGREYVKVLAENDANLVIADLDSPALHQLAADYSLKAVPVDLRNEESVISGVASAGEHLGAFDCVINNAAVTGEALQRMGEAFAPFEEYPLNLWQLTIDVNLTGSFLIARESFKFLKSGRSPSLINVSSIYGLHGPDHRIYDEEAFSSFASYSSSKAGVVGLTKWLATYWANDSIRVNCIVPGGVSNGQSERFASKYSRRIPLGRMAKSDEMNGMVVFLSSDASSYCTGGIFEVDGGLGAW